MALKFAKKAAPAPADTSEEDEAPPSNKKSVPAAKTTMTWMKKGAQAKEAMSHEEAKAEQAKEDAGKLFRFWMPDGEDRQITFLDGKLDDEGMLDIPMFYEHRVKINGNWDDIVCTAEADQTQPCPVCEKGDRPSLVGAMTVIDHSEYKIKNGPNAGKVLKNTRKLFICKRNTIKQLTKIAAKRGGLSGCTFDVSRTGDKSPNVGDTFEFVQKFADRPSIAAKYDIKEEEGVQPADYQEEIRYRSPDDLLALGIGKPSSGVGYSKQSASKNLKDEL